MEEEVRQLRGRVERAMRGEAGRRAEEECKRLVSDLNLVQLELERLEFPQPPVDVTHIARMVRVLKRKHVRRSKGPPARPLADSQIQNFEMQHAPQEAPAPLAFPQQMPARAAPQAAAAPAPSSAMNMTVLFSNEEGNDSIDAFLSHAGISQQALTLVKQKKKEQTSQSKLKKMKDREQQQVMLPVELEKEDTPPRRRTRGASSIPAIVRLLTQEELESPSVPSFVRSIVDVQFLNAVLMQLQSRDWKVPLTEAQLQKECDLGSKVKPVLLALLKTERLFTRVSQRGTSYSLK